MNFKTFGNLLAAFGLVLLTGSGIRFAMNQPRTYAEIGGQVDRGVQQQLDRMHGSGGGGLDSALRGINEFRLGGMARHEASMNLDWENSQRGLRRAEAVVGIVFGSVVLFLGLAMAVSAKPTDKQAKTGEPAYSNNVSMPAMIQLPQLPARECPRCGQVMAGPIEGGVSRHITGAGLTAQRLAKVYLRNCLSCGYSERVHV